VTSIKSLPPSARKDILRWSLVVTVLIGVVGLVATGKVGESLLREVIAFVMGGVGAKAVSSGR
jgi:hypothetical protein